MQLLVDRGAGGGRACLRRARADRHFSGAIGRRPCEIGEGQGNPCTLFGMWIVARRETSCRASLSSGWEAAGPQARAYCESPWSTVRNSAAREWVGSGCRLPMPRAPLETVQIPGGVAPRSLPSNRLSPHRPSTSSDFSAAFRKVAPSFEASRTDLERLQDQLDSLGIVTTLVMGDKPSTENLSTKLRIRGSYLSPGETVYAGTPAALNPWPEGLPKNRLGLAKWLVSRDNPLTSRVAVNRIWEQYFGHGIVETSEDFGAQGDRPTHPELLDWLAVEFMDRGWSQKAIHRLIVTSATYRQILHVTPDLEQRDPYNRLLARGPGFPSRPKWSAI